MVKNLPAIWGGGGIDFRKIPWRKAWQPPPVFLPGESHGQRSLAGYRSWGHKESDTTEQLTIVMQRKLELNVTVHGDLFLSR